MRKINNSGTVLKVVKSGQVCLGNSGVRQKKTNRLLQNPLCATNPQGNSEFVLVFFRTLFRKCKFKSVSKKCPKHPKKHRKHLSGFVNNVVEVLKKWSKISRNSRALCTFFFRRIPGEENRRGFRTFVGVRKIRGLFDTILKKTFLSFYRLEVDGPHVHEAKNRISIFFENAKFTFRTRNDTAKN
jgi:hypothetical protein